MIPRRITAMRMPTPRPIFAPVERPPLFIVGLAVAEEALPDPVEEDEADDVEDCISADDVDVDVELEEELEVEVELPTSPIVVWAVVSELNVTLQMQPS
jgi:hypothetical protein